MGGLGSVITRPLPGHKLTREGALRHLAGRGSGLGVDRPGAGSMPAYHWLCDLEPAALSPFPHL